MHKRLLGAALAMGALLAGSQASQPNLTPQGAKAQHTRDLPEPLELVSSRAQGLIPDKPADTLANYVEKIAFRPMTALEFPVRFVEKLGRRKVKYGRHRWVMV